MTVSRREFIASAGASALLAGLPANWVGGAYASEAPESPKARIGIIALTDCSSIVMAHELGLFKKYGIDSTISKEASWAVIRDRLSLGENLNVGRVLKLSRSKMLTQDHHPRLAALRLHRLPAVARPRLARHRGRRDAHGHAGRRRLPLAGVQQPRLLPHHPERHHDRRHRLRPRPPDGPGRGARFKTG